MDNSTPPPSPLTNPFWSFSLHLYRDKAVKQACLTLQDGYHVNVNLLLVCCWLAYAVDEVTTADLHQAFQPITTWQQAVTQPLRQTRRWLKSNTNPSTPWLDEFYQRLLHDELLSESYQQQLLYALFAAKQKQQAQFNSALAQRYLYDLFQFQNMNQPITAQLAITIESFVELVLIAVAQ